MKPVLIISMLISCFLLSCRKDDFVVFEEPEIIEPFTVKHLEGSYTGTEETLSEEWHYSGPITESHYTTWPYTESTSIRPAWAIVKNPEGNILNIQAEDVDFWYPNFNEAFELDSTLVYEETDFKVDCSKSNSDSLIINLTVEHFHKSQDWISYTENSDFYSFTLKLLLLKD
jgi:hypothetical protein